MMHTLDAVAQRYGLRPSEVTLDDIAYAQVGNIIHNAMVESRI